MSTAVLDIRPHLSEDGVEMWSYRGGSNRLVVCFSGIGREPSEIQPYEFAKTATGDGRDNVLFVSDTRRSWLNAPGLIETIVREVEAFGRETSAEVICTLGHSMGGFMALVIPAFTKVDRAVAYAPQFSVHPDIAGDDSRWMEYRKNIKAFPIASVEEHLNTTTQYFVFHGRHPREAPQRDRFSPRQNLVHTILPNTVHNVPQKLKQMKLQEPVTDACFRNKIRRVRLLLEPLGAVRRKPGDVPLRPPSKTPGNSMMPTPDFLSEKEIDHDNV